MKRFGFLAALVAFAVAIPLSHWAFSGTHPKKVLICHVTSGTNAGVIISVSPAAAQAHLKHGDCILGKTEAFPAPGDPCKCESTSCEQKCDEAFKKCVTGCNAADRKCQNKCTRARDICRARCD